MFAEAAVIPLLVARGANVNAIVEGGLTALELAREAAGGGYKDC